MLGLRHDVFKRATGNPFIRYWWRRTLRFDRQTGLLSAGIPLAVTMVATITVATVILDRQFELRDMRQRTISRNEATLEEEHKALRDFLKGTEDEYEMKQIPDNFRIAPPNMAQRP
eukprot:TRINITY_DN72727_c0_g1_i1.p1 TRINITY_DN72727_c0_g1~~TRINITY_DN72727_c0_g1_i1.p1  ORF type:complete len:116 (+),score=18.12 TRINITY_DN72727_c0_g1_i1:107-454(+)